MITIIAGCRHLHDYSLVENAVRESGFTVTHVITGNAPGIDLQGERWAEAQGLPFTAYPAQWTKYGRAAGPIRNAQMAREAEALVAIWDGKSPGTKDMIKRALLAGCSVYVKRVDP